MILDSTTLTGVLRKIEDLNAGDIVALERTKKHKTKGYEQEVLRGTVLKIEKASRWTVYIDVPTYFLGGTQRTRWTQKVVGVSNSSKIKIHIITGVTPQQQESTQDARKQRRRAHASQRKLLQHARSEFNVDIALLQGKIGDSLEIRIHMKMDNAELKTVRRAVARSFHPDKFQNASADEKQEAEAVTLAFNKFQTLHDKAVGNG